MIEDIRKVLTAADFDLEPDNENTNEIIVKLIHLRIVFSIDTYNGYYGYCIESKNGNAIFTDEISLGGYDLAKNVLEVAKSYNTMEQYIIDNTLSDLLKARDNLLNFGSNNG